MYKDKEKQKDYWRDKKRKQRMSTPTNVHPEVSTPTDVWYPNKRTDDKGKPITPITLTDGQLFYPKEEREMSEHLIETIEEAARIFKDRDIRYERAYSYKHRKEDKTPVVTSIVDQRPRLEKICQSLKNHNVLDKVWYGVGKHSLGMDTVQDLLETTS